MNIMFSRSICVAILMVFLFPLLEFAHSEEQKNIANIINGINYKAYTLIINDKTYIMPINLKTYIVRPNVKGKVKVNRYSLRVGQTVFFTSRVEENQTYIDDIYIYIE